MKTARLLPHCLAATVAAFNAASAAVPGAFHEEGLHASGARWAIDMPAQWNGTVLLYGHGYSPTASGRAPETAPRGSAEWLLGQGYALAASSYSAVGWALEEAPRDQIDALDAFVARHGKPRRTIAWGTSMGGLTSLAMAERYAPRIDAALSLCGSVSGSLGMLNTALDGAFAFRTLLASESDIRLVGVDDDAANSARVRAVLERAGQNSAGRARVALAATLAQIPHWTDVKVAEPAARDFSAQAQEQYKSFVMGAFLPRVDQERRAGGIYSWNTGVDYRTQLRRSGRESYVRALYRAAGLDLDQDLATLNVGPRIAADPAAVAYMRANFIPSGQFQVPVLALQTVGDGLTVPATHGSLRELARSAGRASMVALLFARGAGHCTLNLAEQVAALRALERRLDSGRWSLDVARLRADSALAGGGARFTSYTAPVLLRHCGAKPGSCPGEPSGGPPIP